MKPVVDRIAQNIKRRRKQLGLTQEELGTRLSYSVKAVSKWESGRGVPPTVLLPDLARELKISVDQLLSPWTEERYYLGIDGGGTKTEFALADAEGNILQTRLLGTSNPVDIGINASLEVLRTGISDLCADLPKSSISLFAGLAGGTTKGVSDQIGAFLNSLGFAEVGYGSDAKNAISAGIGKKDGIIVILGTGSVTFAQSRGRQHRIGGYGYLLGDAGSGFALGRDAILAALQAEDGSGEKTLLYDCVKARLGGGRVLERLGDFYEGGKREIASFAPCFFEAYGGGDPLAKRLLRRNLEAVASMIRGAAGHLSDIASPIPVVLCGGLSGAYGDEILPILRELLSGEPHAYELSRCERSMIYGALTLAGMPEYSEKKENHQC